MTKKTASTEKILSVGEATIDQQHGCLLNQIKVIQQILIEDDVNMGLLRESIQFLYLYIRNHFSYEEQYLKENKYPGFEKHKAMHDRFIEFYDRFQKELRERSQAKDFSSLDIKDLMKKIDVHLTDWWINHINKADQEYAKYFRNRRRR